MTVLVGIRCTDGVVIGSDSAMTFGWSPENPTIEQFHPNKVDIVGSNIIVAATGHIGVGQRFTHEVEKVSNSDVVKNGPAVEAGRILANAAVKNFASTDTPKGRNGALVALPIRGKAELIEFQPADFQPEVKTPAVWYASMGSGQVIADPLLGFVRTAFWKEGVPDLQAGLFAATFVLKLACDMAPVGVSHPLQMAVLRKGKEGRGGFRASRLSRDELAEHEESVTGAIDRLGEYRAQLAGKDKPDAGPPGPPPAR